MDFINVLEAVNSFITWGWGAVSLPLGLMLWIHMVGDLLVPYLHQLQEDEINEYLIPCEEADAVSLLAQHIAGVESLMILDFESGIVARQGRVQARADGDRIAIYRQNHVLDSSVFESTAAQDVRAYQSLDLGARERDNLDCEWEALNAVLPTTKVQATKARTQEILGYLEDDKPWERDEAHIVVVDELVYETIPGHEVHLPLIEFEGRFYLKEPSGKLRPLMVPTSEELGS